MLLDNKKYPYRPLKYLEVDVNAITTWFIEYPGPSQEEVDRVYLELKTKLENK